MCRSRTPENDSRLIGVLLYVTSSALIHPRLCVPMGRRSDHHSDSRIVEPDAQRTIHSKPLQYSIPLSPLAEGRTRTHIYNHLPQAQHCVCTQHSTSPTMAITIDSTPLRTLLALLTVSVDTIEAELKAANMPSFTLDPQWHPLDSPSAVPSPRLCEARKVAMASSHMIQALVQDVGSAHMVRCNDRNSHSSLCTNGLISSIWLSRRPRLRRASSSPTSVSLAFSAAMKNAGRASTWTRWSHGSRSTRR